MAGPFYTNLCSSLEERDKCLAVAIAIMLAFVLPFSVYFEVAKYFPRELLGVHPLVETGVAAIRGRSSRKNGRRHAYGRD